MKKILAVLTLITVIVLVSIPAEVLAQVGKENVVHSAQEQIPNVKCAKMEGSIGTDCIWSGVNFDYVFLLSFKKEDVLLREKNRKVVVGVEQTQTGLVIEDINGLTHVISKSKYENGLLTVRVDERILRISRGALVEFVFYTQVHPKNTLVSFSYLYSPEENSFVTCEKSPCPMPTSAAQVRFTSNGIDVQKNLPANFGTFLEVLKIQGELDYFGNGIEVY